jgi:hypothetical protein
MKTRWAIAAGATLALLGARAASAAEPVAKLAATPTVESTERAVCEDAAAASSEEFSFTEDPKCEDYGFFAADKKADCEKSCKKGRKCQKKERCGDTGCPDPGYCWKCG